MTTKHDPKHLVNDDVYWLYHNRIKKLLRSRRYSMRLHRSIFAKQLTRKQYHSILERERQLELAKNKKGGTN